MGDAGQLEPRSEHADNDIRPTVESDRLSDNRGVAAEPPYPEVVAQHDRPVPSERVFPSEKVRPWRMGAPSIVRSDADTRAPPIRSGSEVPLNVKIAGNERLGAEQRVGRRFPSGVR
jgi:hypothetical protein